ncbi:MAG: biopolymer transporter ExbD [Desulfuromonadales bacterium]|nr:biopolymer transporter ExbD [Desulfuromonadales bacterium]
MDEQGFESINVIPFIDIMLVLLTIVLTTSTFIASGSIAIQLPQASQEQATMRHAVTIEIDGQGVIYIEGSACDLGQLDGLLADCERETPVLIRADRALPLQRFVDVMDLVKKLGFARVSVQTERS